MIVRFSRHAKQRGKLYAISEASVRRILEAADLEEGEHEFIEEISDFKFPIKIIVAVEGDVATVITNLSFEERNTKMKVYYDDEIDALYLKLGDEKPNGVIEISEGVNLDTTSDGRLAGIEILKASKKIDIRTILSYSLELDKSILTQKVS